MGLDNGFILKNKKTGEEKHIIYWRKHYDYRHEVLFALKSYDAGQFEFNISVEELDKIIENLTPYLDKEFWLKNSDTIWDFNKKLLKKDLTKLKNVKKLLKKYPNDYTLEFYDSY